MGELTPTQFVRHCFTFWECEIERTHITQVGTTKTTTSKARQVLRKIDKECFTIFSSGFTFLLKLYVSRGYKRASQNLRQLADDFQKAVARVFGKFFATISTPSKSNTSDLRILPSGAWNLKS